MTVGPRTKPVTAASILNCTSTSVIASIIDSLAALRFLGGSPSVSRFIGGNV
ncbi:Uncharacterised protein [Mycobacteroides abscessus subsp. abscessus]|nr:Uncharacterised protein [Mycobacteroides abscessus subsp. abscessus]